MSVCRDKDLHHNAVESSKRLGAKGAIMDNTRCEMSVALYGDTSDCSPEPYEIELELPRYFAEAYAVRDAFLEEDCWYFPVLLRFEEFNISVTYNPESNCLCCSKYIGDIITPAIPRTINNLPLNDPRCLYWTRIDSLRPFAGEFVISISSSHEAAFLIMVKLGNGTVVAIASRKLHFG